MFEFIFGVKRGKRYFVKMISRETGERFVSSTFKTLKEAKHFSDNLDNNQFKWELV